MRRPAPKCPRCGSTSTAVPTSGDLLWFCPDLACVQTTFESARMNPGDPEWRDEMKKTGEEKGRAYAAQMRFEGTRLAFESGDAPEDVLDPIVPEDVNLLAESVREEATKMVHRLLAAGVYEGTSRKDPARETSGDAEGPDEDPFVLESESALKVRTYLGVGVVGQDEFVRGDLATVHVAAKASTADVASVAALATRTHAALAHAVNNGTFETLVLDALKEARSAVLGKKVDDAVEEIFSFMVRYADDDEVDSDEFRRLIRSRFARFLDIGDA